jgi:hypothetical protein
MGNAGAVSEVMERLGRACKYALGIAIDCTKGECSPENVRDLAVSIADEVERALDALEALLGAEVPEGVRREIQERWEELDKAESELFGSESGEVGE